MATDKDVNTSCEEAVGENNKLNASEKPSSDKIYKIQTKEGEICEVSASVLGISRLVATMLEDLNLQDDDAPIPILNVSAKAFKKVMVWCEKHKSDANTTTVALDAWDKEFFDVDHPTLFEIIMAANYLDIPKLLDDGCIRVAQLMKDKSSEEIRRLFNITNDFTPEEEEQIRRENAWCA